MRRKSTSIRRMAHKGAEIALALGAPGIDVYKKIVTQIRRQMTLATKEGVEFNPYTPPKKFGGQGTINRAEKYLEYIKTKREVAKAQRWYEAYNKALDEKLEEEYNYDADFFENIPDYFADDFEEPPEIPQVTQYDNIDWLREYAEDVANGIVIVGGYRGKPSGKTGSDVMKDSSDDNLELRLEDAIEAVGEEVVNENIGKNKKYFKELVELIVLAIYNQRTAKWGGGLAGYEILLDTFYQALIKPID